MYCSGTPVNFRRKKADEIIAYLTINDGHPTSKALIASYLWENTEEQYAMDSLYKAYSSIQAISKQIGVFPVKSITNKLYLDKGEIYCDMWEFEELYRDKNPENWRQAETLFKGAIFSAEPYSWLIDHEGRYELMYYEIVEYLADYYEQRGRPEKSGYYKKKLDMLEGDMK